jgi:hypothetical protein
MGDKTLKSKAISIKGKEYVMVKDRITYFNETYPNGSIDTGVESDNGKEIVFYAMVTPDVGNPDRTFTGYAGGIRGGSGVDSTSAIENAETSAVGRALAMMGIGIIDSVASADEINKVSIHQKIDSGVSRGITDTQGGDSELMTKEQEKYVKTLIMRKFGIMNKEQLPTLERTLGYKIDDMTKKEASDMIGKLNEDGAWVEMIGQKLMGSLD